MEFIILVMWNYDMQNQDKILYVIIRMWTWWLRTVDNWRPNTTERIWSLHFHLTNYILVFSHWEFLASFTKVLNCEKFQNLNFLSFQYSQVQNKFIYCWILGISKIVLSEKWKGMIERLWWPRDLESVPRLYAAENFQN